MTGERDVGGRCPQPRRLSSIPGVRLAEPFRAVGVTLRSGHRSYRTALTGVPPGATLQRLVGVDGRVVPVPAEGMVLSTQLARILGVAAGGSVRVEVQEGRRPARDLPVAGTVDDVLGASATASLATVERLMGEERQHHARDRAQEAHRNDQNDGQRQREALILGREDEEHQQHHPTHFSSQTLDHSRDSTVSNHCTSNDRSGRRAVR